MTPEPITLSRILSFFWTTFVIAPVFVCFSVVDSLFFFINSFNYQNFAMVKYEAEGHHAHYKDNAVFHFTAKFLTIIHCTVVRFYTSILDLKKLKL